MTKKDHRLVFTTDPEEARRLREQNQETEMVDVPPAQQKIRVALDRKRRRGKTVTVASGFRLTRESLDALARQLKQRCAAGGSSSATEIEIQGEHLDTVRRVLESLGYRVR